MFFRFLGLGGGFTIFFEGWFMWWVRDVFLKC